MCPKYCQPQCCLQLVYEDRLSFVRVELIFAFLFAGSCIQNASGRAVRPVYPVFCKLRSSSNPHRQNSDRVRSGDSNSCNSATVRNYRRVHMIYFLTMTDTIDSQNIGLSTWNYPTHAAPVKKRLLSIVKPTRCTIFEFTEYHSTSWDLVGRAS